MVAMPKPETAEIRHPLAAARAIAESLVFLMSPHCERIEIGGSIRRQRETVKDIELVLIPKASWFAFTDELLASGVFTKRHGWGQKARFGVHVESGINVDMFTAEVGNFGYQWALRTGPGELNTRLMTWLKQTRAPIRSVEGYWHHGDRKLLIPTEADFHAMLGIPFVPPEERTIPRYANLLNDPARQWPDFSRWYKPVVAQPAQQRMNGFDVSMYGAEVFERDPKAAAPRPVTWLKPARPPRYRPVLGLLPVEYGLHYNRKAYRCRVGVERKGYGRYDWPMGYREHRDFFIIRALRKGLVHHQADFSLDRETPKAKGQTVLSIDKENKLQLTAQNFADGHVAVVGATGSGKSNCVARLIEMLVGLLPFTIVDIEGEYRGLRTLFDDILIVGRSDYCDVDVPYTQIRALARFSYEQKVSVILDFSHFRGFDKTEMYDWLEEYFKALWDIAFDARQPYKIVLEEAPAWVPQGEGSPIKEVLMTIGERGRKRGLTYLFTAQRLQRVEKNVVEHTSLMFLHRVVTARSLDSYIELLPSGGQTVKDMKDEIRGLENGQAIVLRGDERTTVHVHLRQTPHGGSTPQIGGVIPEAMKLRTLDTAIAQRLRGIGQKYVPGAKPETLSSAGQQAVRIAELETENRRLMHERDERDAIIAGLEEVIDGLMQALDSEGVGCRELLPDEIPATVAPTLTVEQPTRSPEVLKNAQAAQQRNFDRLRKIVAGEERRNRMALLYLTDNPGLWVDIPTIARHTGFKSDSIRLGKLVEVGLVQRRNGKYQSRVAEVVRVGCPDLDVPELVAKLTRL